MAENTQTYPLSYAKSRIYIPTEEEELKRVLSRTREQIVEQRARVATQIKSKLHYFGRMDPDDDRAVTESYLKELAHKDLDKNLSYALGLLSSQWRFLTEQIKEIEKRLPGGSEPGGDGEKIPRVA